MLATSLKIIIHAENCWCDLFYICNHIMSDDNFTAFVVHWIRLVLTMLTLVRDHLTNKMMASLIKFQCIHSLNTSIEYVVYGLL